MGNSLFYITNQDWDEIQTAGVKTYTIQKDYFYIKTGGDPKITVIAEPETNRLIISFTCIYAYEELASPACSVIRINNRSQRLKSNRTTDFYASLEAVDEENYKFIFKVVAEEILNVDPTDKTNRLTVAMVFERMFNSLFWCLCGVRL